MVAPNDVCPDVDCDVCGRVYDGIRHADCPAADCPECDNTGLIEVEFNHNPYRVQTELCPRDCHAAQEYLRQERSAIARAEAAVENDR